MFRSRILAAAALVFAITALPACNEDSDTKQTPAPLTPAPSRDANSPTEIARREAAQADAKRKEAEKKLAGAEAALAKATKESADPKALAALTKERDEARAKLDTLIETQKRVAEPFQGTWVDAIMIADRDCEIFVEVEGLGFQKLISCSTDTDIAFLNQYESGTLTSIGSDAQGRVIADFTVEKTSCRWSEAGKKLPVARASQSGTLAAVTVAGADVLNYLRPTQESTAMFFSRALDACEGATGLRARVCAYVEGRGEFVEPNAQLGCFVTDEGESFRRTGLISLVK